MSKVDDLRPFGNPLTGSPFGLDRGTGRRGEQQPSQGTSPWDSRHQLSGCTVGTLDCCQARGYGGSAGRKGD